MKANHKLAIALAAGIAISGAVIQGLHAQATPPTYVVVDISEITDAEGFKAIPPKASPASLATFGGKYVIRTENTKISRWLMELRPSGLSSSRSTAWSMQTPGGLRQSRRRLTPFERKRRGHASSSSRVCKDQSHIDEAASLGGLGGHRMMECDYRPVNTGRRFSMKAVRPSA
jgi:hypothetical protein